MRVQQGLQVVSTLIDLHRQTCVAPHFGNCRKGFTGLLEHDIEILHCVADANGMISRRAAVPVGIDDRAVTDRIAHRANALDVLLPVGVGADLDLELADAFVVRGTCNLHHALRVRAGDRVISGHAICEFAAE